MELLAAINGIKMTPNDGEVILFTDSRYVKDGITDWIKKWKLNNWKTSSKKSVKNKDLWLKLDYEISRHNINWNWVKGHSGDHGNERADYLATSAIK